MPRRVKGEGSIYQQARDGRWVGMLDISQPGEPRRRRAIYGASREQVRREMAKLRREYDLRGDLPSSAMTVERWLTTWLNDIAARDVKPTTLQGYRSKVDQHLIPQLGRHRLDKLKPEHVRALDRTMAEKGLAQNTRRQTHVILARALEVAMREGKVLRNAANLAGAPRQEIRPPESLPPDAIRAVLRVARGTPWESRWHAALMMGLRQGEALGMGWEQVNLEDGDLLVTRALAIVDRQPVLQTPKSVKSKRPVPMPAVMLSALEARRDAWQQEPRDSEWASFGLVWARQDGSPTHPRRDYGAWHELLASAGVPKVSLHTARHSAATTLAMLGVPLTDIMAILGHSSAAVTLRYIHPDLGNLRKAMAQVDTHWRELEP